MVIDRDGLSLSYGGYESGGEGRKEDHFNVGRLSRARGEMRCSQQAVAHFQVALRVSEPMRGLWNE